MAEPNKPSRDKAIVELKLRGLSTQQIAKVLAERGYLKARIHTIDRIWQHYHEENPKEVITELERQQLQDITTADPGLRLKYRHLMLERYSPTASKVELSGLAPINVVFSEKMKSVPKPDEPSPNKL
jgi:hypothetical protein